MASRFLNLLATIPKQTGTCYSAGKYVQTSQTSNSPKKSSRSCERYNNCKSDSLSRSGFHPRSCSQPAAARRPKFQYDTRRNYREERDEEPEEYEGYRREEVRDDSPFYYESSGKDIRNLESAREISPTQSRLREIKQLAREKEFESESVQYELEATRPREPNVVYDIFEHFSSKYSNSSDKMLPHLQPGNLKPFGSTNSLIMPTQIKSANIIKYPLVDTHEAHSINKSRKSRDRESDDMQRREFSTFKNLSTVSRKENPGYRPANKMSQFIKSKENDLRDSEIQPDFDDPCEMSTELKTCNDIIEKHRNLNAKYYQQKQNTNKHASENKISDSTPSEKYRYKISPPLPTSAPNIETRKKFDFGSEKKVRIKEKKSPLNTDPSKILPQTGESIPWSESEVQLPSVVRSPLPINILQSTAKPEESQLKEKIVLGPNQKLGVPWPSYSERIIPKKSSGLSIVYPSLPTTDSMKTPPKTESVHVRDVQKRGISTESKFRLDGGLFSNDCRLRHVLSKKEVVDSICQKSNAFKENLCCRKNYSALNYFPSARYSSTFEDPCEEKKVKKEEEEIICEVSIRKKPRKRGRLPKFIPQDCPCIDPGPLKEGEPFKRLKPKPIKRDKEICITTDYCAEQVRADDGLEVKDLDLPIMIPKECPCVDKLMKDAPPLRRLKKRPVKVRDRVCEDICQGEECCPPRADKNMKVEMKCLPQLEPSDCPCVEPKPMKTIPLTRLHKKKVKPPRRICPKVVVCDPRDSTRADTDLTIEMRDLPKYVPSDCPCKIAEPPSKAPKLKRLKKVYIKAKKCKPEKEEDDCRPRSDEDDWQYVYHHSCYEEEKPKSEKKHDKHNTINRKTSVRKFSTYTNYVTTGQEKRKTLIINESPICKEKDQRFRNTEIPDAPKKTEMKFPSSPFKSDVPWGMSTTRKFSTYNVARNHVHHEEPECFLRRPISTDHIMAASLGEKKTSQKIECGKIRVKKGIKCTKFNLADCPPKARKSCKERPPYKECSKLETPYPSFSECNEVDVVEALSECPTKADYLQPNKPIIRQLESFTVPPPHQGNIDPEKEDSCIRKKLGLAPPTGTSICSADLGKKFLRQKDFLDQINKEENDECKKKVEAVMKECCEETAGDDCSKETDDRCCIGHGKRRKAPSQEDDEEKCLEECRKKIRERKRLQNMTVWERIVNYFRARPDCPSPEEFKRRMLRERAERAAAKAGLCVYDPTEICSESKELPKVITAKDCEEEPDCKPQKEEEEVIIDKDTSKCKKFKFACSQLDGNKKTAAEFPKEQQQKEKTKDKSECNDGEEKDTSESVCQKLKQCICGPQKRTYSTWREADLDDYILSKSGSNNSKEREIKMEIDRKLDELITQGYADVRDPYLCLLKELRCSSNGCLKYLENNDIETELQDLVNSRRTVASFRCEFLKEHAERSEAEKGDEFEYQTRTVEDSRDKKNECFSKEYPSCENRSRIETEKHKTGDMGKQLDEPLEDLGSNSSRNR